MCRAFYFFQVPVKVNWFPCMRILFYRGHCNSTYLPSFICLQIGQALVSFGTAQGE